MARKLKSDKWLFMATLLLIGTSVVMVYSASAVKAMDGRPYYFLFKQLSWAIFGVCGLAAMMRLDYRNYRQPAVIWTALGVATFLLVLVLFGPEINGARRWFAVAGIGVQPSEFAKLAVILFVAAVLERRMDRINDVSYSLGFIGLVTAVIAGLILVEPDLGTATGVAVIVGAMVLAAGLSYRWVGVAVLLALPMAGYFLSVGYRWQRLTSWTDPWVDRMGDGYQLVQSLIAVGTGGLLGLGVMQGVQSHQYLPEAHTDFIYAVIAEETGIVGASAVLLCFGVIGWRGFRVALRAPDRFGSFLAIGITTMVIGQAFLNMSVVLGLLPTTGIPLPFVSAGGSSLISSLIGMGILLNVSQHASVHS